MFVDISPDERKFAVTSNVMVVTASDLRNLHRRMQNVFRCTVTMTDGVLTIELIDCCSFPLSVRLAGIHRVLLGYHDVEGFTLEYDLDGKRFVRYTDGSVFQRRPLAATVPA